MAMLLNIPYSYQVELFYAVDFFQNEPYPVGEDPPDLRGLQAPALLVPMLFDGLEDEDQEYGQVLVDVEADYQQVGKRHIITVMNAVVDIIILLKFSTCFFFVCVF